MTYKADRITFMLKTDYAEIVSEGTSQYLTVIVLQKNCYIYLGKRKLQGYIGDVLLLKEGISFHAEEEEAFLVYYFSSSLFDSLFYSQIADCRILIDFMVDESGKEEYLYYSIQGNEYIENILSSLREESSQNDMYHEKMIRLLLVGLFTELERGHHQTLIVAKSTMISDNRFGKIMKYLGDNFQTATLANTAEKFGYNPDYLSMRFKKITGETFRHKLLSIRLEKAADLLLSTEMTVDQISEAVGFHDKSWFMHKFKEHYEMTPGEYRKNRV